MKVAEAKRRNNISEFIIHMYQTEDLIRAFDCDMELIKEYVLKHIPSDEAEQQELTEWYGGVLNEMKKEGIVEQGHLSTTQQYVDALEELKGELLLEDDDFKNIYEEADSSINEMMSLAKGLITSEVQICLNGIYGLLLSRVQGRKIPDDMMQHIEQFGEVLSYLSFKYRQKHFMNEN